MEAVRRTLGSDALRHATSGRAGPGPRGHRRNGHRRRQDPWPPLPAWLSAGRTGRPRGHDQRLPGPARHARLLRPAFELLGLSVGLLPSGPIRPQKRRAYACDITYGTGYEFGFDYLRDQLSQLQPRRGARRAVSPIAPRREAGRLVQLRCSAGTPPPSSTRSIACCWTRPVCRWCWRTCRPKHGRCAEGHRAADRLARQLAPAIDFLSSIEATRRPSNSPTAGQRKVATDCRAAGHGLPLRRPWPALRATGPCGRPPPPAPRRWTHMVRDGRLQMVDEYTGPHLRRPHLARRHAPGRWRSRRAIAPHAEHGARPRGSRGSATSAFTRGCAA